MARDAMQMVASLIGPEEFAILITELPDEYFDLSDQEKGFVWAKLLRSFNRTRMTSRDLVSVVDEVVKDQFSTISV